MGWGHHGWKCETRHRHTGHFTFLWGEGSKITAWEGEKNTELGDLLKDAYAVSFDKHFAFCYQPISDWSIAVIPHLETAVKSQPTYGDLGGLVGSQKGWESDKEN